MIINVEKSRTKNSVRNMFFASLLYISKMVTQFVVRSFFIRYFFVEYLGVNGLFTNILNVLSLAELGIGNAIVYEMYTPIAQNDKEKIYSLINLYKRLYMIIAVIITFLGILIVPFLPYFIKDYNKIDLNLTLIYLMYLFQTVIGYFFAYRRSILFAFQRNDIESIVAALSNILLGITQVLIITVTKNYYLYTGALVFYSAFDAVLLYFMSFKLLPKHKGKAKKLTENDTSRIKKNVGALFCHKIGSAIVLSTDSIIISMFIGTHILGLYSNYSLVVSALGSLLGVFMTAVRSSVGNLIADKNNNEVYNLFNAMFQGYVFVVGIITVGLVVCFQDFIILFAGDSSFLLPEITVIIIVIEFYILYSKNMCGIFKETSGLFWNDRYRALVEAAINLILDIILVKNIGINGVMVATIISTLTTVFWLEPYILFKHYFKKSVLKYFALYVKNTIYIISSCVIASLLCGLVVQTGILGFLFKGTISVLISAGIFIVLSYRSVSFHDLIRIIKNIF